MRGVTSLSGLQTGFDSAFQPALPMRGVTEFPVLYALLREISTRTPHAGSDGAVQGAEPLPGISTRTPHAGSDEACRYGYKIEWDFNPHSTCGE